MKIRRSLAVIISIVGIISLLPISQTEAAKKPKLNITRCSLFIRKEAKILVKNGNRKASVDWKLSKKGIVKITKKSTSNNTTFAIIKAVKPGKVKLKATYRLASQNSVLSCIVTVKKYKERASLKVTSIPAASQAPTTYNSATSNVPAKQTPSELKATPVVTISPVPSKEPYGEYLAINEENFPDDDFRAYIEKMFDFNKDYKLSQTEICNANEINASGIEFEGDMGKTVRKIESLKGIEYFSALISLDCSNNPITTLDISKNTVLRHINCLCTNLTTIDISNNPYLDLDACICDSKVTIKR